VSPILEVRKCGVGNAWPKADVKVAWLGAGMLVAPLCDIGLGRVKAAGGRPFVSFGGDMVL